MTMSFAVLARAQAAPEPLPNGDVIFEYQGKRYLGLTGDHAHEMNAKLDRLEQALSVSQQINIDLRAALEASKSQLVTANLQTQSWKELFDAEHALRLKADALIKHPGKVSTFFDRPLIQILTKVGIPAVGILVKARSK